MPIEAGLINIISKFNTVMNQFIGKLNSLILITKYPPFR